MKNQSRKARLAAGVAVAVIAAPGVALASHVFDDVADDRFFAEPVEWAADNEITTGVSPTLFAPDDPVTRGESVTFLKRYEDNVVAPRADATDARADALESRADALETRSEDLEADIDDAGTDIDWLTNATVRATVDREETNVNNWDGSALITSETLHVPSDGFLLLSYVVTVTKDSAATSTGNVNLAAQINVGPGIVASTQSGMDLSQNRWANFRTVTIQHMEPVEAGEVSVSGVIAVQGTPADSELNVRDQTLTAIFVPIDLADNGEMIGFG